jgi:phage terminase large subunit GpA-like protein
MDGFGFDLSPGTAEAVGVRSVLHEAAAKLAPLPKVGPLAWGAEHRKLSSKETSQKGDWDPERTPWAKEILWELSDESPAKIVVAPKGAQLGFTEIGLVWMGWSFCEDPGTMMVVWPTDNFIKRQVKQRVDPFFEGTPALAELFGTKQSRGKGATLMQRSSAVGELIFASGKSAANLRGTPAVRLMADEIDEASEDLADQGDVVELALGRVSDAGIRAKVFVPCTPTIESTSIVWWWWLLSDQRKFMVPCPHCGTFQELVFEQLVFDRERPHLAEYRCAHCDGAIREIAKRTMLPAGRFEATAVASYHRLVGFHVSSLYAPLGSYSWGEMATQFVSAGGREDKLKAFTNLRLGLPWKQHGNAPSVDALAANKEPYALGTLPARCGFLTAGADVQKDRVEVYVWGWGPELESWLVGRFIISRKKPRSQGSEILFDDRSPQEVAAEIKALINDVRWRRADGASLPMTFGLMDVNFDTTWAWQVLHLLGPRWGAVRGAGGADEDQGGQRQAVLVTKSIVERDNVSNLVLYRVSSPMAFSEFYRHVAKARPEPDAPASAWANVVHLPDSLDDDVLRQLTADREVWDARLKRRVWTKSGTNEAGDCRKYARAALEVKGVSKWGLLEWQTRFDALEAMANRPARSATEGPASGAAPAPEGPGNAFGGYLAGN